MQTIKYSGSLTATFRSSLSYLKCAIKVTFVQITLTTEVYCTTMAIEWEKHYYQGQTK